MQYIVFLALLVLMPMTLALIDRRIKGTRSVLTKIVSVVTVMGFVFLMVYFYGQQILSTFKVNLKSFTNIKEFFNSRMLVILCLLIFMILVIAKFILINLVFKNFFRQTSKTEKAAALASVFFDLVLIPNIFVNSSLFTVFALVTLVELGLVYGKLVFSISFYKIKEVLA